MEHCGIEGRVSDSPTRERGFESCAVLLNLGQVCQLHIALVHLPV